MDNSGAVRVVQRLGHFPGDSHRIGHRERPFPLQPLANRAAGDVGHDIVDQALALSRFENGEDIGMLEPGGHLDFAEEALGGGDEAALLLEHLDGDPALEPEVLAQVDHGHATAAELMLDRVAARKGALKAGQGGVHRVPAENYLALRRPAPGQSA